MKTYPIQCRGRIRLDLLSRAQRQSYVDQMKGETHAFTGDSTWAEPPRSAETHYSRARKNRRQHSRTTPKARGPGRTSARTQKTK